MGFRCKSWNDVENKCNRPYEECKPQNKKNEPERKRCNYGEFIYSLGNAPNQKDWGVFWDDGSINVEATAKRCYEKYPKAVPNFRPHAAMKGDVYEWNDYLKTMGEHVDKTYRDLPEDKRTDVNLDRFRYFDEVLDDIITARVRDHGPYL
ncbi:hypothetical protein BU23DRAFT_548686 [Bimuria novae-zelandiae CBS 107.79]|uniref:Uncharacterized protein n=1 Tax=Bimuria novae-zelandiae CBS 107.79 TaxID=1447943 RepID=A0A6A5VRP9_9PLEO|nr:hypothetical protein BU23DRAFT_548686 [Bimuria novae-zelandiae CBS 107.79]